MNNMKSFKELNLKQHQHPHPFIYVLYKKGVITEEELLKLIELEGILSFNECFDKIDKLFNKK